MVMYEPQLSAYINIDREMYIYPLMNAVEMLQELQIIQTYGTDRIPLYRALCHGRSLKMEQDSERSLPEELSEQIQEKYSNAEFMSLWKLFEDLGEESIILHEGKKNNYFYDWTNLI